MFTFDLGAFQAKENYLRIRLLFPKQRACDNFGGRCNLVLQGHGNLVKYRYKKNFKIPSHIEYRLMKPTSNPPAQQKVLLKFVPIKGRLDF